MSPTPSSRRPSRRGQGGAALPVDPPLLGGPALAIAPAVALAAGVAARRGAVLALGPLAAARPDAWSRTNHRGGQVSLTAGPATAVGLALPLAGLALTARSGPAPDPGTAWPLGAAAGLALAAAAVGRYDDTAGERPAQRAAKGLRGHLAALRAGRLTAGTVKVVGIGAAAGVAVAAAGLPRARLVPSALLVAGAANLVNLFDLRPGRALKAAALPAVALAAAPTTRGTASGAMGAVALGVVAAGLPDDLAERSMLGDTGANALGAVLGLAVAVGAGPRTRACALAVVLGLTAASEVVSFSRVIDAVPPLARLDRLGRAAA